MTAAFDRLATEGRNWLADHPRRRYRLRPAGDRWVVVRRRPNIGLLRTSNSTGTSTIPRGSPDSDEALRPLWVASAWAFLGADAQTEILKEIRKIEPGRRGE
jgi:hypothetical protein